MLNMLSYLKACLQLGLYYSPDILTAEYVPVCCGLFPLGCVPGTPVDPNIFVKMKTGRITRGHDFTLVKGQSRLDFRNYSFTQRTVNEWHKLSADCVHSSLK